MKSLLTLFVLLICTQAFADNNSIYQVKFDPWQDDAGKNVALGDLKGKKVVLAMVYTSCQYACPLMVKKLLKLEQKLKKDKIDSEFVVISFDSKYDSPKKLADFRKHQAVPNEHWHLYIGTEKSTRALANILDIKFSRNPEDQTISHDNKVVLLNEEGVIVRSLEGLSYKAEEKLFNL